jgi:hypothetical protein
VNQQALNFDAPAYTVRQARAAGEEAGQRAADKAERLDDGFRERAQAFVLAYLKQHGVSSSEMITDAAKLAGIKPHEDRAFGPVYATLARTGKIVTAWFCARRKGHGSAGGRLWRLA